MKAKAQSIMATDLLTEESARHICVAACHTVVEAAVHVSVATPGGIEVQCANGVLPGVVPVDGISAVAPLDVVVVEVPVIS